MGCKEALTNAGACLGPLSKGVICLWNLKTNTSCWQHRLLGGHYLLYLTDKSEPISLFLARDTPVLGAVNTHEFNS